MTHKITGGVISIEDGKKAAEEYAPARKVRVELHFDVPEGADHQAHIDAVSTLAHAKVKELLGGMVAAPATTAPAATAQAASAKTEPSDKEKLAAAAGLDPDAVKKAAHEAEVKAAQKAARAPRTGKKAETNAAPAADLDELATATAPVKSEAGEPTSRDDELFTSEAQPISDADLHHAIGVKNHAIENPAAIKKLIGSYNPDPTKQFSAKQIPDAQRVGFIEALEKLTKDSK